MGFLANTDEIYYSIKLSGYVGLDIFTGREV